MDARGLREDTIVIFLSDHGEMNGAHRMAQNGAIHYDEAAVCNLTVCVPGGPQGKRTAAVGSHLDLAPTLLDFRRLTFGMPPVHDQWLSGCLNGSGR